MKVTLIGLGCGTENTLTRQAEARLREADCVIGARRLLEGLSQNGAERIAEYRPGEILTHIMARRERSVCVVYSGDTGFYSGAGLLLALLRENQIEAQVLPGISSVQYFAAAIGERWQDWNLCSAHGVDCDVIGAVSQGKPAFFLLGSAQGAAQICKELTQAGLGGLRVTVGENLTYPEERIYSGSAEELAGQPVSALSVMLVEPAPSYPQRAPGIPDGEFVRGGVPMTKQEVRAAILAKLAVRPSDVCWDIGGGTGSVAVELAMRSKAVWCVERDREGCELIQRNRSKFAAWNLRLVEGEAPKALEGLPAPDVVFVGGSGGNLPEILGTVHRANRNARVCVSAIALETLQTAAAELGKLGYSVEVTQISVSRTRAAGELHLLMAQNPVFLITGVPE